MKSIIIFATKYGCTEKTAKMLKAKMSGDVLLVNVMKEKVPALDEYDNVILGGSIYMGKIQKVLTAYISDNLSLLLKKRIALFVCAGSPDPETRKKELESVFPAELYRNAVSKELFGYELSFEKMGFLYKMITKAMKGDNKNVSDINEDNIDKLAKTICKNNDSTLNVVEDGRTIQAT